MAAEEGDDASRKRKFEEAPPRAPKFAPLMAPAALAVAPRAAPPSAAQGLRHPSDPGAAADGIAYHLAGTTAAAAVAAVHHHQQQQQVSLSEIAREITINDAPARARLTLTKRTVQDDIQRRTHTVVATKGRYYAAGVAQGEEKPLFLSIRPAMTAGRTNAERQAAVDAAAAEIEAILAGKPPGQAAAAGKNPLRATVYVGFEAPPSFELASKLIGPRGSFIAHIARTAGVTVRLQGRGAGGDDETTEPMHITISGADAAMVNSAKEMAQDLLATVRKEFEKAYPRGWVSLSAGTPSAAAAAAAATAAAMTPAAPATAAAAPAAAAASSSAPAASSGGQYPNAYQYPYYPPTAAAPGASPAAPYGQAPQQPAAYATPYGQPPPQQHPPHQQQHPPHQQQPGLYGQQGYPPQQQVYPPQQQPYGGYMTAPGYSQGAPYIGAPPGIAGPRPPMAAAPYGAGPPMGPPMVAPNRSSSAPQEPKRRRFVEGPPSKPPPPAAAPSGLPRGPQAGAGGMPMVNPYAQYGAASNMSGGGGGGGGGSGGGGMSDGAAMMPPPARSQPPPGPTPGTVRVSSAGGLPGLEGYDGDD